MKNKKAFIAAGYIAVGILTAVFLWFSFGPQIIGLVKVLSAGDEAALETYLSSMGHAEGLINTFILSVLQVITIVFPCLVVEMAAGVIYGLWEGFFVTFAGFVAGHTLVYYVVKKLRLTVPEFISRHTDSTWIKRQINSEHPNVIVRLAYMVPGLPNGLVPYLARDSVLSVKEFMLEVIKSSWIQVFLNCLAGAFLIQGEFLFVVLSFVLQGVLVLLIYHFHKKELNA